MTAIDIAILIMVRLCNLRISSHDLNNILDFVYDKIGLKNKGQVYKQLSYSINLFFSKSMDYV